MPSAAAPAPSPAPLAIKLVGTIVESGHSRAAFVEPDGKTRLVGVGQTCGGAQVLRIETDSVTVRYLDKELTLAVPKEGTNK